LRPSLGALTLTGGFRELARVGMGNGGSLGSVRLGLLTRWCVAMPFWIMAALRMPLDLIPSIEERGPLVELDLLSFDSRLSRGAW
jgi:hypothetical protein